MEVVSKRRSKARSKAARQKSAGPRSLTRLVTIALIVIAGVAVLHGDNGAAAMALIGTGFIRH